MSPGGSDGGLGLGEPTAPRAPAWRRWAELAAFVLLAALIIAGGVVLWQKRTASRPLEISLSQDAPEKVITAYVGGAVTAPGVYVFRSDASIADALQAAGGATADADLVVLDLEQPLEDRAQVLVPRQGDSPQRVNVNTAEAWLLEALPGIGEKTAAKIIDYRSQNGPFQRLEDLRDLKLVNASTFDKIRDKITLGP